MTEQLEKALEFMARVEPLDFEFYRNDKMLVGYGLTTKVNLIRDNNEFKLVIYAQEFIIDKIKWWREDSGLIDGFAYGGDIYTAREYPDLKPCPLCGSKAKSTSIGLGIACSNEKCLFKRGVGDREFSRMEHYTLWNKRSNNNE